MPNAAPPAKATTGRLHYGLIAGVTLAIYLALAALAPLLSNASTLADISTFAPWPLGALAYALLLVAAFALYWLAYRRIDRPGGHTPLWALLLPPLLFGLPLILTYPFNATDVYRYWLNGRIITHYGESPYQVLPGHLLDDPLMRLAGEWATDSSPYGPLWELIAAGLARISTNNLQLGLLLFKALGLLTCLGIAYLIWQGLASAPPGVRAGRTLLWAWNPALLLTFVANAHNDVLMLFWLVLGWLLMRRGRPAVGLIVMLLAPLTKPSGLLPIPFFLLAALHETDGTSARLRLLLAVAAGGLAITWLAFLPFGSPLDLLPGMVKAANAGAGYSPAVMVVFVLRRLQGYDPLGFFIRGGLALLALLALWLAWRTWRGRAAERAAADINAGYLLLSAKFRIWYASWIFPWLLLDTPQGGAAAEFRLRAGVWFLLTTQLSVLIYGQARIALLGGEHLWTHLVGVPFTFGLPLLLAALPDAIAAAKHARLFRA